MKYFSNKSWDICQSSKGITIMTPVFNRAHIIKRTLDSVKNLKFDEFEHIIVDDGSEDNIDEIIFDYLKNENYPILYIKKDDNGGVHTARNIAIKEARKELIVNLDSDDELLPDSLANYYDAYSKIEDKENYREVLGQYMDIHGNRLDGIVFPDGFNSFTEKQQKKILKRMKKDYIAASFTNILKDNLFPEPEGIKFVLESNLFLQLSLKYKTYYLNDMVAVKYDDSGNQLSKFNNKYNTDQKCIDNKWNALYYLNNLDKYPRNYKRIFKNIIKANVSHILLKNDKLNFDNKLFKFCSIVLMFPSYLYSKRYKKN